MTTKMLMTAKETAATLGITVNQVYRYMKEGKLKSLKMGGSRRFTEEHIKQFIKGYEDESQG
jgi:excisionase family DNA binding protein|tara:strand:+ start:327 stop:512 length:186 start_codon:yes stop_codon:yes gene_type:complete